jgi:hypothetical protein
MTVTFDISTNIGEVNFANFIAKCVMKGIMFKSQVKGCEAIVEFTGGF